MFFHIYIGINDTSMVPTQPDELTFRWTLTTSIIPLVLCFALFPIYNSNQILISKEYIYSLLKLALDCDVQKELEAN